MSRGRATRLTRCSGASAVVLNSARHYSCGGDIGHQCRNYSCRCGEHLTLSEVTVHTHRLLSLAFSEPRKEPRNSVEQCSHHNHDQCQTRVYRAQSSPLIIPGSRSALVASCWPSHTTSSWEPDRSARRLKIVDAEEHRAQTSEGLDPDDPRVVTAIDLVRWELSLLANPDVCT